MATFNVFSLLDSDEEDKVVVKAKPEKAPKPKPSSSKPGKENQRTAPAPSAAPAAGSGWNDKEDVEQKRRIDGRRGGRGGRVGMGGKNGRDFDRRSGTGRGREMKKEVLVVTTGELLKKNLQERQHLMKLLEENQCQNKMERFKLMFRRLLLNQKLMSHLLSRKFCN